MTALTHLIRRDLPLEPGRKLAFTFTVAFEVTLDEDLLQDQDEASLDDVERWLGGEGRYSDVLYRALANNNDRNVIEHEVSLTDRYEGADDGEVRFETTWEQREREQGQMQNWLSRVWLDEVPSAGALPLGPGSNLPVPTTVMIIDGIGGVRYDAEDVVKHPTAEEVMSRDG